MDVDTIEKWLENGNRVEDTLKCIRAIVEFSKGDYAPFFENCGLYAVGSSLTSRNPNDIDLVLAGLDFRSIMEYNNIYLQDPETLIAEEIVIPAEKARENGITDLGMFTITSKGLIGNPHTVLPPRPGTRPQSPFKSLRENNGILDTEIVDVDRLEDLDYMDQRLLRGFEYQGQYWAYNFNKARIEGDALSLDSYCEQQIGPSQLIKDFHQHMLDTFQQKNRFDGGLYPLDPYDTRDHTFLTTRFEIHENKCNIEHENDYFYSCRPLDIIVHSENLHAKHWKTKQKVINLPYITVHEWPLANLIMQRPVLTPFELPKFIDAKGEGKIKGLEPPIDV